MMQLDPRISPDRVRRVWPAFARSVPGDEEPPVTSHGADVCETRLEDLLAGLTDAERFVITRVFGIGGLVTQRQSEIAKELKVSRAAISKRYRNGMRRLRFEVGQDSD